MAAKTIVLVTGANTGLGFEMVKAMCTSEKAYDILLAGRSLSKAEQAAKAALQEFAYTRSSIYPLQIDIESDESIQAAFDHIESKFGKLDALVNNAGTWEFLPATVNDGRPLTSMPI